MMRKMLLAAALSVTAMTAHADYQCSVTPRDDVIVSPQTVQVKGENGNLVITPDGNVMYNGKQYSLNAAQREQAKDYQAELRSTLPWIDEGAKSRVEKARIALDKIIVQEMGESSKMRSRLTKLDAQLKEQMNRIIETRSDGLTFHYKAIDQVRAEGQQLVNQAMGGILQDSINEMGAKAVLKSGGNPLQNVLGSLGGLQSSIQTEWKKQEKDFQQFGKDVCSRPRPAAYSIAARQHAFDVTVENRKVLTQRKRENRACGGTPDARQCCNFLKGFREFTAV